MASKYGDTGGRSTLNNGSGAGTQDFGGGGAGTGNYSTYTDTGVKPALPNYDASITQGNFGHQPGKAGPAAPGLNGPFDWSSIFGPPGGAFNLGGAYAGSMGMGNGYSPNSHLDFFQNWDNWRRQMISQNYYLPALGMTNFGY